MQSESIAALAAALSKAQADIDRHNELRRELKKIIEEFKKCPTF